jgi:hypothetical protein
MFGQIINYLLLEYYPLEEESPRFHFNKIVTIENNEINWPLTAKNIIPRFLSHLPMVMIKDLGAIDQYCRNSGLTHPLDMHQFTIGLTAEFMDDIIWSKNEVREKPKVIRFHKDLIPAMGHLNKELNEEETSYSGSTGYVLPVEEHEFYCDSQPVDARHPFQAFAIVRKAWASLVSWFIVVF